MAKSPAKAENLKADADAKADAEERAALLRKQHSRRLLAALDAGYTLTGVRLSSPKDDHENGVVVTFEESEAGAVVAAIKKVLSARK